MQYYFFPNAPDVTKEELQAFARECIHHYGPVGISLSSATLDDVPKLLLKEDIVALTPEDDRESTRRYLGSQIATYASEIEKLLPPVPGEPVEELNYGIINSALNGVAPGTVAVTRSVGRVGILLILDLWAFDLVGRIVRVEAVSDRAPSTPKLVHAMAQPKEIEGGPLYYLKTHSHTLIFRLINYTGQYLAMTGLPGVGLLVSMLAGLAEEMGVDHQMSQGEALIEAIGQLLEQNRINLELDMASSVMRTYSEFKGRNYNDKWLEEVMNAKAPIPTEIARKQEKLTKYVTWITQKLDKTSDLGKAVNLLVVDGPGPSDDLHKASDGMYKITGFLFLANVALALGRAAWNAQYTMEGKKATFNLAEILASYSKTYRKYIESIDTAIKKQVENRLEKLTIIEGAAGIGIYDSHPARHRATYTGDPGDCVYAVSIYCNRDKVKAQVDSRLAEMKKEIRGTYRDELISWFYGTAKEWDEMLTQFQKNDDLLDAQLKLLGN